MFQKLAPLLILVMFAIGAYFMVKSMHNLTNMTQNKNEIKK
ncbi:hypothetical protein MNB_SV-8-825 [hydrothermal vent metagenome]|uniref:Uncharacterized protein n=1 Tax=hydrothermal vent metagenome TaxID=652676 RepID=A0A1W1B9A6_9ZZZZ